MKQSFAWWAFSRDIETAHVPDFLSALPGLGIEGVEMLPPELWPAARDAGLELVTVTGHDIEVGFNDPTAHPSLHARVGAAVESAADAGIPFVIVFSGNRQGSDEAAIAACADGLRPIAEIAKANGVTLLLELLNSKVDHPGYHCDSSAFGFEVARRVDSHGLKILFDIYHMQVMEGNILATIRENIEHIGHIHTAGVPGRRDLDDRQELNWRAIAGLLRHLDYSGWVGHEFVPRQPPLQALAQASALFSLPD